ncbi:MAG: hypothetical protein HFI90_00935 [Clostridia bacterium]|nr:hypothetical protein [Clostridia bacterium]
MEVGQYLKREFGLSQRVLDIERRVTEKIAPRLRELEAVREFHQIRVLNGFRKNAIREQHFLGTTGYGYDDLGREAIDALFADVFGAEDALVRMNIVSGTHALSLCLFGVLRPGDKLVSVTGNPYDTLAGVISAEGQGSLKDFGVSYDKVPLLPDGTPDLDGIRRAITPEVKAALIQRSKGYDWRETLSVAQIGEIIRAVKEANPQTVCIVDNCYGEFTEEAEPTAVGADLMAGSLIKNPGGGLARGGAYLAGKKNYIDLAAYKLNCVGQGKEIGPTFGFNREILQGFFMAPHVTCEALKAAVFCAGVFEELGYDVCPRWDSQRGDIIQAVRFGNKEALIAFCQGIQKGAPIDSFVQPEPWDMPGYDCQVIMAAGAFTQGATTELSADAPVKPPYVAYMQGSLTYECGKTGVLVAVQNMIDQKLL